MNGEWIFKNKEATQPLRIPLNIVCNTSEDEILRNVLENSKKYSKWLNTSDQHDGIALLCGSGPSIRDDVDEIVRLHAQGARIFALNGAAKFLNEQGIYPDYQVIMDAQPQTVELIGEAREHLFASQCHPETLAKAKNLTLWHATFGNQLPDEQEGFPKHEDGYCLIGSFITVGGTSLILTYAMGYREIHCFGYDSSHRDKQGHVLHQPINDGDPCTLVEFQGKEYLSSFTMAGQARHFLGLAATLKQDGCRITVHGSGLLPDIYNAKLSEKEKYKMIWQFPEYREVSPGELAAEKFVSLIQPKGMIADFGCGTGRGGSMIHKLSKQPVTLIDFADNCLDRNISLPFIESDLSDAIPFQADYGFCTDVMEHIPDHQIDTVIENIMASSPKTFFQICLVNDHCGMLIGHTLHLSIHPFEWWIKKFIALGYTVAWSDNLETDGQYYVTSTT